MVTLGKNSFDEKFSPSPFFLQFLLKTLGYMLEPRVRIHVITERPQFLGAVLKLHVEALGYRWGAQVIARGPRL